MKTSKLLLVSTLLISTILISSCKKDDPAIPTDWVTSYSNITLGDQNNTAYGHFLKPQTGESVSFANATAQQKSLALIFFTEVGGHSYLTFPANGESATLFGTKDNSIFTKVPGGIDSWDQSYLNSGMIPVCTSMTSVDFNTLLGAMSWTAFDQAFKDNNSHGSNLAFEQDYVLGPKAGLVYLIQFNGLVRAILCVKSVSGVSGGNIRFDMIIEGRAPYLENSGANLLQPARPL